MATPKVIVHDDTLPPLGQAMHTAILAMRAAKAQDWSDFNYEQEVGVSFSVTQQQAQWLNTLDGLDIAGRLSITPMVTVAICDECKEFVYASARPVAAACRMTFQCTGKVRKISSRPPRRK